MELDSSQNAEALKIGDYHVAPVFAKALPTEQQLAEINGKADSYPHELHKNLMNTVVPLRAEFRKESTVEGRKQIAQTEFDAWKNYLVTRKEQIAAEMPDFHIHE